MPRAMSVEAARVRPLTRACGTTVCGVLLSAMGLDGVAYATPTKVGPPTSIDALGDSNSGAVVDRPNSVGGKSKL